MIAVTIFGSNQGDKHRILQNAKKVLADIAGTIVQVSSFYETAPWGFTCQENFLNQVVVFDTPLPAEDFLYHCLETEKQFGRQRTADGPRYSSRPIDIDILFYDHQILHTPDLIIPHPRLSERNFVLAPLAEIMPEFIHPVLHKTIAQLWADSPDPLSVKKVDTPHFT